MAATAEALRGPFDRVALLHYPTRQFFVFVSRMAGAAELLHRRRDHDPLPPGAPDVHAGVPSQGGQGVPDGQAAEHLQLPRAPGDAAVPGGVHLVMSVVVVVLREEVS